MLGKKADGVHHCSVAPVSCHVERGLGKLDGMFGLSLLSIIFIAANTVNRGKFWVLFQ